MWKEGWDREQLISKYKEGIDFCIKHGYPNKKFIKENFTRDILRDNAVLVDDTFSLLNCRVGVLLGNSTAKIRYNGWNGGTIYVLDESSATLTASNMAFVIVHLFGSSTIECTASDKASVLVLRHSETAVVLNNNGSIKVKDELDYLKK